jgi:hypothetical protein
MRIETMEATEIVKGIKGNHFSCEEVISSLFERIKAIMAAITNMMTTDVLCVNIPLKIFSILFILVLSKSTKL